MTVPLDWQASAWPLDRALSIERVLFPSLPSKESGVAKLRRNGQDAHLALTVRDVPVAGRKGQGSQASPLAPASDSD